MHSRNWSHFLLPVAAIIAPSAYAADYLSVAQAQAQLFPSAKSFIESPIHFSDEQRNKIQSLAGVKQRWETQQVWRVEQSNGTKAWFVIDQVIGKHEFITYATAISADGKVIGIEILKYLETHGGQVREASWRKNFVGKTVKDEFRLDEDVPNISGATLSCRNVLDGVKRLLVIHQLYLAKA
jgi:Na+-translocating ferredoxin:NAD+ oxidoreductase RnfG subunit